MRPRYAALLAVIVLLVLGYVGFWFWMARAVEQGVQRWAEDRRAEGMEVGWDALSVGGFPFRLEVAVEAPRLAQPRSPLAPEWRGERLVAYAEPWSLRHVIARFEGQHELSFRQGEQRRRIGLSARAWLASWAGENGRARVDLDLRDAVATDSAAPGPTRAARLQVHARPGHAANAVADLALQVSGLLLPSAEGLPLGPEVTLLEVDAALMGPLPPPGLGYPEAVLRWRDDGGVVEVRRFALEWGEVRLEANGTLALDAATRPEGAFSARLWNHRRLLEALVASRAMSADDARLAAAALDLLAAAGNGAVAAPISAQNGRLWLGPAAVARLSPLLPGAGRNPAPASPAPQR